MEKGLTKQQANRLLEDIETIAMTTRLLVQVVDNFGRDVRGMLNGNLKEKKNGEH